MIQRLLILGGGSDIGVAFVDELMSRNLNHVVLAGRKGGTRDSAASQLRSSHPSLNVEVVDFDGADAAGHDAVLRAVDQAHGPFDAVVVAFGQLGEPFTIDASPADMAQLATVNFSGAVSATMASLNILRGEPNARLIVFSSVAAVRPRIGNIVYGSAKAGLDAFARELAAPAKAVGVEVVVVRPGFVHTRMTEGVEAAPFATTADVVAKDMVEGIEKGKAIIHSPAVLGPVGLVLKNLPAPIWRIVSKR
jgi:decaprenylphospho-beta-D-erythro-pentofuranosid-2-ulose 2-reductase